MRLLPAWAEDWRGATVLVAASGPSQRREDIEMARGRCRVWVINTTWRLAPWADVLYFCDANWWFKDGPGPGDFAGRQIVGQPQRQGPLAATFSANVQSVLHMRWDGETIGAGKNSGFQSLNLLALWGVARVILTGFDHQPRARCSDAETHWHGPHEARPNPKAEHYETWRTVMARAAGEVGARGVEVINASRDTALTCFPRARLEDVL